MMEQKICTYNQLLDKLRQTHPVLDTPDELTGNIIRQIEHLQDVRKKNQLWSATAWFSGIAAACFFGFMMWETAYPSVSTAYAGNYPIETFVRYTPPDRNGNIQKHQFYRTLEEKQKIKSTKHRLYTNYISHLNNK